MSRSLLILFVATLLTCDCTSTSAQGRSGKSYRSTCRGGAVISRGPSHAHASGIHGGFGGYRSYYPSSLGVSIGIGGYPGFGSSRYGSLGPYPFYGYRSGYDAFGAPNFEAPDLLKDPYFRAQHKFDSRFPGRYRTPLVVRQTAPVAIYNNAPIYPDVDPIYQAASPTDLEGQLRSASQQLTRSLATLQYPDAWIDYLAPHRISRLMATGNSDELRQLLTNYDGVIGDPKMRSIEATDGFRSTRILLSQYLRQRVEAAKPTLDAPTLDGPLLEIPATDPLELEELPIDDPTIEKLPLPNPVR